MGPFEMLLDDADALQCVLRALNTVGCRDAAVAKVALMSTCKHFQPGHWLAIIMLHFGIEADGIFTMDPDSLLATVAYRSQEADAVRSERVVAGIKLLSRPHVLNFAAGYGLDLCARALLEAGADPNKAQRDGWTALMYAAVNGHEQCAGALLEAKCNVNARLPNGEAALDLASQNGHLESTKVLIEAGADVELAKETDGPL